MWSKIVGHSAQIDELKKAISSSRLPNAYLFTGPRGIGKRMIANAMASAIVCPSVSRGTADPCGMCPACHRVKSNSHPDIFVIEPESARDEKGTKGEGGRTAKRSDAIKIDEMRELKARLQFHPLEAPAKLAIIDDADRMTEAAANSLLKVLEEPPPVTHFVLISAQPHLIPPTIRSRTRRMAFAPLKDDEVLGILATAGASGKEAVRIAKLSGGSPGSALSIDLEFAAGVIARLDAVLKGANSADIIEAAEEWSHSGEAQAGLILDLMASWYRDCIRLCATGDETQIIHREAATHAKMAARPEFERGAFAVEFARRALETAANKQLMFESLLFTLTS